MFFALLVFPSAALAWRPAPGIPLERQIPAHLIASEAEFEATGCAFLPDHRECNGTETWCSIGYYSDGCWMGNYCLPQVLEDGCPGICPEDYNWETQDWCDMGMDSNNCWLGNWCQYLISGGCPAGSSYYDNYDYGSGSGSCDFEAYTQECNSTEIYCDAGNDGQGCWLGNYCVAQVESDGCPGMCSQSCDWNNEDWCDMGVDSNGCWLGNYCQDIAQGGCPDVVSTRGALEKKKAMDYY